MITTEKGINRYDQTITKVYLDKNYIGYYICEPRGDLYTTFDWDGSRIYTLDTKSEYKNDYRLIPAKSISEAKQQILNYYLQNKEKYEAYQKEEEDEKAPNKVISREGMKLLCDGNSEFYPTPSQLAGRMIGKIKTSPAMINRVLEPSAGKGDLLDNFAIFFEERRWGRYRKSCESVAQIADTIESDRNLQLILRGKGYRVITDDFLKIPADYPAFWDLILMNPPFENGDEHLLKAIQLQKRLGGEIICLLNAETIRNPYTNLRQILKYQLTELNADIEFVKNAFSHAERCTDVEVAIVHILIPRTKPHHNIADSLNRAKEEVINHVSQQSLSVTGNYIAELVGQYKAEANAGEKIISEFCALAPHINYEENEKVSEYSNEGLINLKIGEKTISGLTEDAMNNAYNQYLILLRNRYWLKLFNRPEVKSKLTSDMQTQYHEKLSELCYYEFSEFNIEQILFEIEGTLIAGVEDSIMKLFSKLSDEYSYYPETKNNIHYYNGWRSNLAHMVSPKKVIIPLDGFYAHWDKSVSLNKYNISSVIRDLEMTLSYLDRGEVAFHVDTDRALAIAERTKQYKNIEFTYFDIDLFKKGTCHIKFHADAKPIIDRLNIFASRKKSWLPPCYGKISYSDMTSEEQEVIRSFHDDNLDEYEQIVQNPEQYLISSQELGQKLLSA